ncbi:hypothetical protein M9H77_17948 [Catharanthus roseus]|uniref:Uncharacterized protein n=1 Tax=Catharanthus roseus TaxID=4058 RepID=A0ACC0B619_CATRO|nr:hypothetical protein M9H77_17948 [Catharanthus roseus]
MEIMLSPELTKSQRSSPSILRWLESEGILPKTELSTIWIPSEVAIGSKPMSMCGVSSNVDDRYIRRKCFSENEKIEVEEKSKEIEENEKVEHMEIENIEDMIQGIGTLLKIVKELVDRSNEAQRAATHYNTRCSLIAVKELVDRLNEAQL